jgi:hypothetical protein
VKSSRNLRDELQKLGHKVSHVSAVKLLKQNGYSLQRNFKADEGANHEDRDRQFKYINALVKKTINFEYPVISVDTKKKELIGKVLSQNKCHIYCIK